MLFCSIYNAAIYTLQCIIHSSATLSLPPDQQHVSDIKSNQIKSDCFIVRLKVDQRAGQLSLPHLGITKTEKIELKHKTATEKKKIITTTIFIVLLSMAPAICESSLWFTWAKVGQRQVAANS